MKKIRYRCEFKFNKVMGIMYVTSDRGIGAYRDGFWINEDYKLTVGIDAKYWIPPSQIEHIAKDLVNYD